MDREGATLELIDEIDAKLGIAVVVVAWPIGMGKTFRGVWTCARRQIRRRSRRRPKQRSARFDGRHRQPDRRSSARRRAFRDGGTTSTFVRDAARRSTRRPSRGHQTPVRSSARRSTTFGVRGCSAGHPGAAAAFERGGDAWSQPDEPRSPASCSRSRPTWTCAPRPHRLPARRRAATSTAACGSRSRRRGTAAQQRRQFCPSGASCRRGLCRRHHRHPQPRRLQLGDTVTDGPAARSRLPFFAPEMFRGSRSPTRSDRKQLKAGLTQLGEEGAIQVFRPARLGAAARRGRPAAVRGRRAPA